MNDDGGLIAGRSKEAIDIVLHSTSYSDIEAAGQYLMHTPDADWDLGKDAVAGTAMAGKLRELQQVAVESVACSYSGTCEAGGLKTMQVCAMRRVCAPGITLYDVWDMIYSPQEMAVVAAMQRALLDQRRSERTP
ncbi:hypothetical protein L2Y94_03265 [Luteibacter aegosomatis]|uniref:hypothetical protein n=1 Tax=Luteibacter aegosomatis TaxID=2911537 RepID=UPI001FFB2AD0|nr:hypothetical protein [Luteibacter aegosomatis]UPG86393.1 hypothetical protein L2Y94_03265 [Luteibacter aegosomatis]